jgi:cell division protein FtsA
MFNLPFNKKTVQENLIENSSNCIVLDIGTEVLKGMLFSMDSLGVNVKRISRINQQEHAMKSGIIKNLDTVLENCKLCVEELTNDLPDEQLPKHVIMGIAGEYVQGVSIVVNYQREENFQLEVTEKEQDRILSKVKSKIEEGGKQDLSQRIGLQYEDIDILHITATGTEIGGMPVNSLVGYTGKDVKLHFYASFAPKTYVEALKKVANSLNLGLLGIVSQPFAVARAFSGSSDSDFNAIFIDIGGGTTDIAVVEKGNITETKMFGFGGRVFTKEISKLLNSDYRHAEQQKIKYSEKDLTKELSKKIQNISYNTAKLWMKTLKAALDSCDDVDIFPSQVYLCGGGSLLPEMKEVMIEFPWKQLLPFPLVPQIKIFRPELLSNINDSSGKLKHVYDITPASLAKFAYDQEMEKMGINIVGGS